MEFDDWYGDYVVSLRARGYKGPIDPDEARKIFTEGQKPDGPDSERVEQPTK